MAVVRSYAVILLLLIHCDDVFSALPDLEVIKREYSLRPGLSIISLSGRKQLVALL